MERDTLPLSRESLEATVNAALSMDNTIKKLTFLMLTFTGIRNDTFCHIYAPNWLTTSADDVKTGVKLKVPESAPCRKYGDQELCGDCNGSNHDGGYEPKTPAGEGRTIPIPNTYKNYAAGPSDGYKEEYMGLADLVTTYFKINDDGHGALMPGPHGNGLSKGTSLEYVKEIGQKAHEEGDVDLKFERGVTDHRRLGEVPDLVAHDLRGSYIVQCIRNDLHRTKLIDKTGHKSVDSLEPYEEFESKEVDAGYLDFI